MKKLFILFCACLLLQPATGQRINNNKITHYMFPSFTQGAVLQKSGVTNPALLNYNTLTNEIVFQSNGQQLALAEPLSVQNVNIGGRVFIPVDNMFYEVVTNTAVPLCVQRQSQLVPPGSETGFGKSQTSAIVNVSDLKASGMAYVLNLPDDFEIITKTTFWLKKNDQFKIIKNANDVKNEFVYKVKQIDDYLKTHKVNFKSVDDLARLIEFCNSPE